MKRRIYKKWLKNPMNKRLIWKFCKPFTKIPVAYVRPPEVNTLAKAIERMERKMWEETMIPNEQFLYGIQGSTTSGNAVSVRLKERVRKHKQNLVKHSKVGY